MKGLEPSRIAAPDPKSGVSAIPPRPQIQPFSSVCLHTTENFI